MELLSSFKLMVVSNLNKRGMIPLKLNLKVRALNFFRGKVYPNPCVFITE